MWIVCQIGAREHYAIPRALHGAGSLACLLTDFWIKPGAVFGKLPGGQRLKDRFHPELIQANVIAPNIRMLGFEMRHRLAGKSGWPVKIERNRLFQREVVSRLARWESSDQGVTPTLFSYSYSAREIFRFAKQRGWKTVLGQIDPGPEEERIVAEEHRRCGHIGSQWQPVPDGYWDSWKEEIELADRVIVNSEWSRECLLKQGVPERKMEIVPLVYEEAKKLKWEESGSLGARKTSKLQILFLGQINLRKGVARLLEAMRLAQDDPIELTLAGPSEIDPGAWADLANVNWVGPVPRSEAGRLYEQADVFILPTLSDGYAITQLEALSRGLPVIASKYCGAAVIDGRNGWILSDLEPATIRDSLLVAAQSIAGKNMPNSPAFGLEDLATALRRAHTASLR